MMRELYRTLSVALVMGMLSGCAAPEHPPAVSVFDDEDIEKQAITRITGENLGHVHVNVTSFNRRLLLTGQVPSAASREQIARIVTGVPKVRAVVNELVVGDISGISSRTSDSWVTSDVKFRLLKDGPAGEIKVTTENGTVFLMGTLRRRQGAAAAELASTTKGVKQVVMVFEYLD